MYQLFDYKVYYFTPCCPIGCKYMNKYNCKVPYNSEYAVKIERCMACKSNAHWVASLQYKDRTLFEIYPQTIDNLQELIEEEFKKLYQNNVL